MSRKDRQAYAQQRQQERSAEILKALDEPMLELMGHLRRYTHAADLSDDPRSKALSKLRVALDDLAGILTGDREYFHDRGHSIG